MPKTLFLDLPIEVRLAIYENIFASHTVRIHSKTCMCADDGRPGALFDEEQQRLESRRKIDVGEANAGQGANDNHYHNLENNLIQQRRRKGSRKLFTKSTIHVDLFLLSKCIRDEATPLFWIHTKFELHRQCMNAVADTLHEFGLRWPDWRIGQLCRPHTKGYTCESKQLPVKHITWSATISPTSHSRYTNLLDGNNSFKSLTIPRYSRRYLSHPRHQAPRSKPYTLLSSPHPYVHLAKWQPRRHHHLSVLRICMCHHHRQSLCGDHSLGRSDHPTSRADNKEGVQLL